MKCASASVWIWMTLEGADLEFGKCSGEMEREA